MEPWEHKDIVGWMMYICIQSDLCGLILRWSDSGYVMICFLRLMRTCSFCTYAFWRWQTRKGPSVLRGLVLLWSGSSLAVPWCQLCCRPAQASHDGGRHYSRCLSPRGHAQWRCLWRMAKAAKICVDSFGGSAGASTYVSFFVSADVLLIETTISWRGHALAHCRSVMIVNNYSLIKERIVSLCICCHLFGYQKNVGRVIFFWLRMYEARET